MKKLKIKIPLIIMMSFFVGFGIAQQSPTSAGNEVSNENISISYSIGEWMVQPNSNVNSSVYSGVIQPKFETELNLIEILNSTAIIYPNPTKNKLSIINTDVKFTHYSIYTIDGKLLTRESFELSIEGLNALNQGTYILILNNSEYFTSQQFLKI